MTKIMHREFQYDVYIQRPVAGQNQKEFSPLNHTHG